MKDIRFINDSKTTYINEVRVMDGSITHTVPVIRCAAYRDEKWISHGFSTRLGGVSAGIYGSLNLSFSQGDEEKLVRKNHGIMAAALGVKPDRLVYSHQTHTTNVLRVTEEHAGMGITRDRSFHDIDGFVTDVPGLMLVTAYADCVPLYFSDRRLHVIGLSHSGWRGTVGRMGEKTLKAMNEAFGTQPQDVIAAIGPSICGDCFEVGPEVVEEFAKTFSKKQMESICHAGRDDRSYLDLWQANRIILEEAGVQPQNISVTNICTRCNPDLLYSHRIMGAQRGNLAAILMIRE